MAVTSKKIRERWHERKALIMSQDFERTETAADQRSRIERAKKDYNFFVETYFPHLAKCKSGRFHLDAAGYIIRNRNARAVFEWARGHAKSTHISLLIPLWLKIQDVKQINVMLLVSKSEDAATMLLSDLQAELEFNELYKRDFGEQIKQGDWASGYFKTADGCLFASVGRGQSPRGIKNRGERPDYIVIDDIDDDEMVRNAKRTRLAFEWCLSALLGTMAMGRGRFIMVGNRIGKDSILTKMIERPGFYHTIVNALDKKGLPSWSENYTLDEIKAIRTTMGDRLFEKEYMNNPITEGAVFERKHIVYGGVLPLREYRAIVCYTDPSFKNSANADYKATVLVGITKTGQYHILKAFAEQTSVSTMVGWHYTLHDWIDGRAAVRYYMESNFIQDLVLNEFKTEGDASGLHIPITGDNRKKPDKFARIEAMQPLFERGLILLNKSEKESPGMLQLVEQLLMFERGNRGHDDAPDALEGAIFLLNKRGTASRTTYRSGARSNRKY